MGHSKDQDGADSALTTDHGAAGGMEVDGKGNRVWRWARGVLDSTSVLLKRLENKDLALDPTAKVPIMRGAKDTKRKQSPEKKAPVELSVASEPGSRDRGGGFDPYNKR